MRRPATACALACLLWLSCAGAGDSMDAPEIRIALPDVPFTTVDENPANPGGCFCTIISSPCPDGKSPCLDCSGSPASCSQCPIPTDPPQACTTLFFRCSYDEAHCDCVPTDGGTGVWSCVICPC